MSEDPTGSSKPFDPFEQFRSMRDAYLDSMAKVMVDAVNTEGYAQATGAMLENSLTISAPFREAMEKSMLQVLQQLSMPSRQDFTALADRFTNLEMRLDDMDAKLDRIEKQTHAAPVVTKRSQLQTSRLERQDTGSEARGSACREAGGQTGTAEQADRQKSEAVATMPAPVMTDQFALLEERLRTINKVMTTKAAIAQTPKELVWTLNKAKLYRYIPVVPAQERHPVPLLLVFALMNRPYILDLRPGHSFVEFMVSRGYDVFLLDWGAPGPEDKNLKFDDYTMEYMPRAIRKLKAITGC